MTWAKVLTMTAGLGLALMVGAALGPAAGTPAPAKTVRAERFELVDGQGKVRAILGMADGEPGLVLSDENGKVRMRVALDRALLLGEPGAKPVMFDADGKSQATLLVTPVGPRLELLGRHGKALADLYVLFDEPVLGLCDAKGNVRARLDADHSGPSLTLWDAMGKRRVCLWVGSGPSLNLFDAAGTDRAVLNVDAKGPSLWLVNTRGQATRYAAPAE